MKTDNASGKNVANDIGTVTFPCPNCQKADIVRSRNARQIAAEYECPECGFTGPN